MKRLLIAAGGGGDAFTASVLAENTGGDTVIASFSWDRKAYDPDPGPRNRAQFVRAAKYGKYNTLISANSRLKKEGAESFLPKIAEYFHKDYFLLELDNGVIYLSNQIKEIIDKEDVGEVIIVDVGGDILATGCERGLKSPIADACVLAACKNLNVPVSVWVAGGGLDGELTENELLNVLGKIKIYSKSQLPKELADRHLKAFEWLPSEASALFILASTGKRGVCEIRQDGYFVKLNDFSATVFRLDFNDVYSNSTVAKEIVNTSSLNEIESIVKNITSVSELDIERKKRDGISAWSDGRSDKDLIEELLEVSRLKSKAGIDFMTKRRLCEVLKIKGETRERFLDFLKQNYGERFTLPLWNCK